MRGLGWALGFGSGLVVGLGLGMGRGLRTFRFDIAVRDVEGQWHERQLDEMALGDRVILSDLNGVRVIAAFGGARWDAPILDGDVIRTVV